MSAGRLIVVSNRIPTEEAPSGGLVVALHDALQARGGIWIGAHPDVVEEAGEEFVELPAEGYQKLAFRISQADRKTHYLGYSNSVLWPLCHHRVDLIAPEIGFAEGYLALNRRVAKMIAAIAEPEDRIWVQDYHFLPLAACLRAQGVTARVGLFLHVPFPNGADLDALSERDAFLAWIAGYDLVGLQTKADVARCLEVFRADPHSEVFLDGRVKFGPHVFAVRSFPIGIDAEAFAAEAVRADGRALLNLSEREELVIGVDRLDYSKGLPNRVQAFGRILDARESDDRRPTLLQIAPPTREDVAAYQAIRDELEQIAGHLNGAHSDLDWTPIRYIHRAVQRDTLAALYRVARVGLVTSLADGMNLVAKEFVAAQDPQDPGVLVLSRTAGAAEQMPEAVLVNAYDIDDIARGLQQALDMPKAERIARNDALRIGVFRDSVSTWCDSVLQALSETEGAFAPLTRGTSTGSENPLSSDEFIRILAGSADPEKVGALE
jgi:trehalose 6-phosphate synthase